MKGTYVDGFLLVIPKNKVAVYKKMAALGKKVWMKHGALDYKECMGDDLSPTGMDMEGIPAPRSFVDAAGGKKGDTVWFSYIVFKNKKHRDQVNKKVMKDPLMNDPKAMDKPMPFEMSQMCYGGFKVEVGA
jgi:uncharacterized protein YbaA (DUF1428 family)